MSRKAAAVPASKAKIGTVYAVRRDGELTRFRVDRVTTHRIADDGGPADYRSEISGAFYISNPKSELGITVEKATIQPNQLLGQYEEYQELVAQMEAEKKANDEKTRDETEAVLDLRRLLYQVSGLDEPNDSNEWNQAFRVSKFGSRSVDMSQGAVKPLLEGLRKLLAEGE